MDQKITNGKRKLSKYKGAIKANWGGPQRNIRWLYTGVIRPGIIYGSLICGKSGHILEEKLRQIQQMALMMQGLFRRSTPGKSLEIISGIPLLHLFILS